MRLRVFSCGLTLPLFAASLFAQSAQQPAAQPAQQPAPTAQAPAAQSNAPTLKLQDLPPDAHTPTPQELQAQKEEQLRQQLTNVARAQAMWGPAESAPGMSLDLKETGRTKTAAGTEITYQVATKGFTPDMKLTLVRWPLNQKITPIMSNIVVDSTGTAVCGPAETGPQAPTTAPADTAYPAPACTTTMKAGAPITLTTTVAKGEAIRLALVAPDRKHGAAVSFVPFPIEGSDKGCKIQVIRGAKDGELVLVTGEGFKQDATYTLGTESYGQKHPLKATINPQGSFITALTPWFPGHDLGDTVIYYQSSTCAPTVNFHWGKDTYKPE